MNSDFNKIILLVDSNLGLSFHLIPFDQQQGVVECSLDFQMFDCCCLNSFVDSNPDLSEKKQSRIVASAVITSAVVATPVVAAAVVATFVVAGTVVSADVDGTAVAAASVVSTVVA